MNTQELISKNIKTSKSGRRWLTLEEGVKNGLDFSYTVSMEQINSSDSDRACRIFGEDVTVWRIEDEQEVEYKATESEAMEVFEQMVDLFVSAEMDDLYEDLQDNGGSFDWMTENIEGLDDDQLRETVEHQIKMSLEHGSGQSYTSDDVRLAVFEEWRRVRPQEFDRIVKKLQPSN